MSLYLYQRWIRGPNPPPPSIEFLHKALSIRRRRRENFEKRGFREKKLPIFLFYGKIWTNFDQYKDLELIWKENNSFFSILKRLKKFWEIVFEIWKIFQKMSDIELQISKISENWKWNCNETLIVGLNSKNFEGFSKSIFNPCIWLQYKLEFRTYEKSIWKVGMYFIQLYPALGGGGKIEPPGWKKFLLKTVYLANLWFNDFSRVIPKISIFHGGEKLLTFQFQIFDPKW